MAVASLDELVEKLAHILGDYRKRQSHWVTPQRVSRWIDQFSPADRLTIMTEMVAVFGRLYMSYNRSQSALKKYLSKLILERANGDVRRFLFETYFLETQTDPDDGCSQSEMIDLANEVLRRDGYYPVKTIRRGLHDRRARQYVYLDDALYSGTKLINDLVSPERGWITSYNGPPTTLYIYTLIGYTAGQQHVLDHIVPIASSKGIAIQLDCARKLVNNRQSVHRFDCLWPHCDYDSLSARQYAETLRAERRRQEPLAYDDGIYRPYDPLPRETLFSSPEARRVVERAFLLRGLELRQRTQYTWIRPLGFDKSATLGFGTLAIPYRNCPNNAPLVLWWSAGGWQPLLHRYDPGRQWRYAQQQYTAWTYTADGRLNDTLDDVPF